MQVVLCTQSTAFTYARWNLFSRNGWPLHVIRKWNSLLLHLYIGSLPLLHVTCIVVLTCHYTLATLITVHWWTISASFSPTTCTGYGIPSSPTYINLPAQSLLHASMSGQHWPNFHQWQLTKCSRFWDRRVSSRHRSICYHRHFSVSRQVTLHPVLAHMANLSFSECCFPPAFKTAQVLPLLKKSGLDAAVLSNCRPISNLSTVFQDFGAIGANPAQTSSSPIAEFFPPPVCLSWRALNWDGAFARPKQRVRGIGQQTCYCTRRMGHIGGVR